MSLKPAASKFFDLAKFSPSAAKAVQNLRAGINSRAGYRELGLKYDDLVDTQNEIGQLALSRLTANEGYDRVFRIRRAMQADITRRQLPKADWTKPEDDTPYLSPLIEEIKAEQAERAMWDNLVVRKK